jgi:hypothetical protein
VVLQALLTVGLTVSVLSSIAWMAAFSVLLLSRRALVTL